MHRLYAESAGLRRSLDRGNPNENALRDDFALLGLDMPGRTKERRYGARRFKALNAAISLRNGLAHGDASKIAAAAEQGATPTLASYRDHRRMVGHLAVDMSNIVEHHVRTVMGEQS